MPDDQGHVQTPAANPECIHASHFFDFYDEDFLIEVYARLLRREPDLEGLNTYLSLIRAGESRYRVLHDVSRSREAGNIGFRVLGMKPYRRMRTLRNIPVLGRLVDGALLIWRAKELMRDLRALENHIYRISKDADIARSLAADAIDDEELSEDTVSEHVPDRRAHARRPASAEQHRR